MIEDIKTISDEELITLVKSGERRAFDELVRRYYRHIYRFLVRFTGRKDLSEDLTQEIFLKVYNSIDMFDESRRFKPWLFAVAANRARDALRSIQRASKKVNFEQQGGQEENVSLLDILPSEVEAPYAKIERRETAERVKDSLKELPEQLREILILAYYEKMPYKVIAETLDIPLGTVKSRLHKAVVAFGKVWKDNTNECSKAEQTE